MKIKIDWVEANGFRAFRESIRFEFGTENHITGDNGAGKSSIMEAIVFAVTGCDKEGKANAADRLISKGDSEMSLSVGISVGGQPHRIDRHIVKHKNKTETTIYLNNNKSNQETIEALVVNRKHFMAAFLLDYFCLLDTKEAREQMMMMLPVPADDVVLAELAESESEFVKALEGAKLADPDVYISREKGELRGFKDELLRLEGESRSIDDALKVEIPEMLKVDYTPIESLRESIQAIEQAQPKSVSTALLDEKLSELRAEHKSIQQNLSYEENIVVCEKCGHHNNLNAEQEACNEAIIIRMGEIDKEIESVLGDIGSIRKENESAAERFRAANAETISLLRDQLHELEQNTNIVERQNLNIDVLQESRQKALERSLSIQGERTKLEQYITNAECRIKAAQAFKVKRCEIQIRSIEDLLDRVSIRLFDIVKSTGEIKPTFKLEYDCKEYHVLSTSEKTRCGLEISGLICSLSKQEIPVFIDNGESITHFNKPKGQLFIAQVVEGTNLNLEALA